MFDDIDKINFTNMSDVSLAKWIYSKSNVNLYTALQITKMIRRIHALGVVRGKSVN